MLNRNLLAVVCILCLQSSILAQTSKPADDALQPQSTWTGNEQGDPRVTPRRGDVTRFATINILSRTGERFTFEYWIIANGVKHGLQVEGQVHNGQVVAQASKILQGGVWESNILDEVWSGGLKDTTLILQRTNPTNNSVATSTLTLDASGPPVGPGGTGGAGGRGGGGRAGRRGRAANQ
jgi:hypothetical protein